jgi:plasmid stabilization system protein ParE
MTFRVRYTTGAREDIRRLYQHMLDGAATTEDLDLAERALAALADGIARLALSPFLYRKAGSSPFLRELIIPFGSAGYVALFEIDDAETVSVLAVRHQLEDDFH